jgi:hypothetical protein
VFPAIQPPARQEAGSRLEGPAFGPSLDEAEVSLASETPRGDWRGSGAGEAAESAPQGQDGATNQPTPDRSDHTTEGSDRNSADVVIPNQTSGEHGPEGETDVAPLEVAVAPPVMIDHRTNVAGPVRSSAAAEIPDVPSTGVLPDPPAEIGRSEASGSTIEEGLEPRGRTPNASLGLQGLEGNRDAFGVSSGTPFSESGVRPTTNTASPSTSVTTSSPTPAALPSVPGGVAVPEGMQAVAPTTATMVSASARSAPSGPDRRSTAGHGPAAVTRAEEVNASIRNDRAAVEVRARSGATQTMVMEPTALDPSAGGLQGSAKPMPASTEAQSLPTMPASLAPEEAEIGPRRTAAGVARGLQALSAQKGGTMIMRLDPPNLGQVRMQLNMEAGRVSVLITAAGDTARSLLRDNLGVLRHALEDRGFAVERLAVESSVKTSSESSASRNDRGDGQDARSGSESSDRQDAGGERSRGWRDRSPDRRSDPEQAGTAGFNEVLAASGTTSDQ